MFTRVVLPAPSSPSSPCTLPPRTTRSIWSFARTGPNRLVIFSIRRMGSRPCAGTARPPVTFIWSPWKKLEAEHSPPERQSTSFRPSPQRTARSMQRGRLGRRERRNDRAVPSIRLWPCCRGPGEARISRCRPHHVLVHGFQVRPVGRKNFALPPCDHRLPGPPPVGGGL